MAFNAGLSASEAFNRIKQRLRQMRADAVALETRRAAGTMTAKELLDFVSERLAQDIDALATLVQTPGLAAYAKAEAGDENYDVVAEFTAARSAAIGCRDWIVANFPASNGFLLSQQIAASGVVSWRGFTAGSTTGLGTVLDALVAAIAV